MTTSNASIAPAASTSIAPAANRLAARGLTCFGNTKAARYILQRAGLVRTGGNSANGLLAIGGASLAINRLLARAAGASIGDLLAAAAACPRVSNPLGKVSSHLANSAAYAAEARAAAAGILQAARQAGLDSLPPYLLVNGQVYTGPLTRGTVKAWPPTTRLESPLLRWIAEQTQAHAPAAPAPAEAQAEEPAQEPAEPTPAPAVKQRRTKASKAQQGALLA